MLFFRLFINRLFLDTEQKQLQEVFLFRQFECNLFKINAKLTLPTDDKIWWPYQKKYFVA